MSATYHSPLRPKPGARTSRVTPRPEPARQRVTNAQWQEQRRKARERSLLSRLIEKVLP